MDKVPSLDPIDWPSLLTFCVVKLQMRPADFWQLTFAEFWPLYNQATGNTIRSLSVDELEDLESAWTGASDGNS